MVGKLGFFLMGVLAALLLDPRSGGKRRAALARRLAPLRQRLMAARSGTTESDSTAAPVTEMMRTASDVAGRAQDQIGAIAQRTRDQVGGSPSEAAGKAADAVRQTTRLAHERAQVVAQQAAGTVPDQAPAQANAAPVTPQDVAPTGQFDPIPEGDPDEAHPGETINDPTLVARIESELYRDDAIPKGQLNIDAVHGVVTFRGTLKSDIADEVLERALEVEGVRDIVDLLQRD